PSLRFRKQCCQASAKPLWLRFVPVGRFCVQFGQNLGNLVVRRSLKMTGKFTETPTCFIVIRQPFPSSILRERPPEGNVAFHNCILTPLSYFSSSFASSTPIL